MKVHSVMKVRSLMKAHSVMKATDRPAAALMEE